MPKRTGDFSSSRLEKLTNPVNAASYLTAALEDSPDLFLDALKDVIQAHKVSRVAQEAGLTRESLYRSFSANGNPTLDTLRSVLKAMDLKLSAVSTKEGREPKVSAPSGAVHARRRGKFSSKRGVAGHPGQLALPFDRIGVASSTASNSSVNLSRLNNLVVSSTVMEQNYLAVIGRPEYLTVPWLSVQANESGTIPIYAP